MVKLPWNWLGLRVCTFVGMLLLAACTNLPSSGFNADSLPSQSEIRSQLASASFPGELRQQIIRLYSRNPEQRAAAAAHLARLGSDAAPAVPYLIQLLPDNTPVQLSSYVGPGYYSGAQTTPADEASHALAEIGGPANDALILSLSDPNPQVRRLAVKALGQIGNLSSLTFLIKALHDPDRGVQATAAIALSSYRHPMAAQEIMDAYPKANPSERTAMIFALAHINDVLAVPFLIKHAKDSRPSVRAAIMLALGKLRDARAIPTLLRGLKDKDEITRANAAYSLRMYYSPKIIQALINALGDKSSQVQESARDALVSMTGINLGNKRSKWQDWWRQQRAQIQPSN